MPRAGAALKVREGGDELIAATARGMVGCNGNEKPRAAIAHDQKINFALQLVAHITQLELAESPISPTFDRLEQMTGDESARPGQRVGDARPVAHEPLRLFAQGLGNPVEPGAHTEAELQPDEQVQP